MTPLEVADLAAVANALPSTWVVAIEPPHGQMAITPSTGRRRYHRAWVASGSLQRVFHDNGVR